jgi:hypothetical protein
LTGYLKYKTESVTVEITRHVLGNLDTVGEDGIKAMINPMSISNIINIT